MTKLPRDVRLTPAVIADAALDLAAEVGERRVSIRAVAERLGRTPMAVHKHVNPPEQLRELMLLGISERHGAADPTIASAVNLLADGAAGQSVARVAAAVRALTIESYAAGDPVPLALGRLLVALANYYDQAVHDDG